MMHDAESLDPEMERLRKLEISRKLLLAILKKHWLLLVLCFFLVTAAGISLLAIETRLSPRRFETRVNLLYFPKKIAKIQSLDDRTLMQIFTRHSTYLKLCGELHLPGESVLSLIQSVEVTQHRRQTNLYTVTAADNRAEGAIQKANLFAELCIREYIAFRTDDLERHREVIMGRRLATQDALEKLHQEEAALNRSEMVTSPAEELVRLQKISADLKNAVGEARVKLINEKNKLEKVREKLKNANPAVFVHSRKIREFIPHKEEVIHINLSGQFQIPNAFQICPGFGNKLL